MEGLSLTTGEWIAFLTALLPFLAVLYRYILLPVARKLKQAKETVMAVLMLAEKSKKLDDSLEKIGKIYEELRPNGGASLRDAINRIEIRQVVSEQRLRAMTMDSPEGIYETDSKGQCIFANRTYHRLTGRTMEELKGNGWINTIAPEDRDYVFEEWTQAVEQKREFIMDYTIMTPDGEKISVHGNAVPIYDHKRTLVGFSGKIAPLQTA